MRALLGLSLSSLALAGCATAPETCVTAPGIVTPVEDDREELGTLLVYTITDPYCDGGVFYYPHRSYEVLDAQGRHLRRVRNHLGRNDEEPTLVLLPPGRYHVQCELRDGRTADYLVEIRAGARTRLDVEGTPSRLVEAALANP